MLKQLFRRKNQLAAVALGLMVATTSGLAAFADTVGFVDYDKIRDGYEKAQNLIGDIKVKEAGLRKSQADYVKRIEDSRKANAKNPVASKGLESQLQGQFETEVKDFKAWSQKELGSIDTKVNTTIKSVAQQKGVTVVVDQRSIVFGGSDLTGEVIRALNASK